MVFPNGHTRMMGLLGQGISYTRSPVIHHVALKEFGINAVYLPIDLASSSIPSFLDLAWELGAMGFNVTTPHKGLISRIIQGRSGSVNTIKRTESGWESTSTDAQGFLRGLKRMGCEVDEFDAVIVLGCGGAVTALLEVFGKKPVRILRRGHQVLEPKKGQEITYGPFTPSALAEAIRDYEGEILLVQATNAPQQGFDLSEFVPAIKGLKGALTDLVYASPSALVEAAKSLGLPAQDGEAMLIEQARLSQEFWWGRSVSYDAIAHALKGSNQDAENKDIHRQSPEGL